MERKGERKGLVEDEVEVVHFKSKLGGVEGGKAIAPIIFLVCQQSNYIGLFTLQSV